MANDIEKEVKEAVLNQNGSNKHLLTAKRLFLDKETIKRIEVMIPLYSDEFEENLNENEKIAALVQIAIKNLFATDFAERMKKFS